MVLSYGFWQRLFGGSDHVIGTTVVMSGTAHQILGVMPRDFESRVLDMRFEFWTPFRRGDPAYQPGGLGPVALVGRLREGITIAAAQSEAAAITRDNESRYQPNFNGFVTNLASWLSGSSACCWRRSAPMRSSHRRSCRVCGISRFGWRLAPSRRRW